MSSPRASVIAAAVRERVGAKATAIEIRAWDRRVGMDCFWTDSAGRRRAAAWSGPHGVSVQSEPQIIDYFVGQIES